MFVRSSRRVVNHCNFDCELARNQTAPRHGATSFDLTLKKKAYRSLRIRGSQCFLMKNIVKTWPDLPSGWLNQRTDAAAASHCLGTRILSKCGTTFAVLVFRPKTDRRKRSTHARGRQSPLELPRKLWVASSMSWLCCHLVEFHEVTTLA